MVQARTVDELNGQGTLTANLGQRHTMTLPIPEGAIGQVLMQFFGVIDGVFGNLDHQGLGAQYHLTAQTRLGFKTPSLVQQIVFFLSGLVQARVALAHDHVTRGASTTLITRVFNGHTMIEQGLAQRVARKALNLFALRAVLGVGQYFDDGHFKFSMFWPFKA